MKKENYPKYVQAVHLVESGRSVNSVCEELHMDFRTLNAAYLRYIKYGELSLLEPNRKTHMSLEEKLSYIEKIRNKELSLLEASLECNVSYDTLYRWMRAYEERGPKGLERKNRSMSRKKAYTPEQLDELEALRRRNEYLEAENALLKKVKALVEEREARLRAIGRKPSKD